MMCSIFVVVLSLAAATHAFAPTARQQSRLLSHCLIATRMVPKFENETWVAQSVEEMPGAGYDVIGTFIRQGPKPAFTRIFQPEEYEQAILKFMAAEECDRNTAQGNMDAYIRNSQQWLAKRREEESNGFKVDYVTIKVTDVALVAGWGAIATYWVTQLTYSIVGAGVDMVRSHCSAAQARG